MVRRRVPEREVDDVVQQTLIEAFASTKKPEDPEALRKWIFGIARNKAADYHRRARRETFEVPELSAPSPDDVDDLLRWATRELPPGGDSNETFEWLLREGDGEKLESIAEIEHVPAPRVRKRVSRLRHHFRSRRAAEIAALAALGLIGIALFYWLRRDPKPDEPIAHDVAPTPEERGRRERSEGLEACRNQRWLQCLDHLDRGKALDPAGDDAPAITNARKDAEEHLAPPVPSTVPSSAPSHAPTSRVAPTSTVPSAPPRAPKATTNWGTGSGL